MRVIQIDGRIAVPICELGVLNNSRKFVHWKCQQRATNGDSAVPKTFFAPFQHARITGEVKSVLLTQNSRFFVTYLVNLMEEAVLVTADL